MHYYYTMMPRVVSWEISTGKYPNIYSDHSENLVKVFKKYPISI